MSANSSSAVRTGTLGNLGQVRLGLASAGHDVGTRLVDRRVGAQQGEGLGVAHVVGEVAVEQLEQAGVLGTGGRAGDQHRQGRHALAQVGAGSLAGDAGVGRDVEDVVGELERGADDIAVLGEGLLHLGSGAAEDGAVARGGGDQRAGLAGHDVEVVLERVLAGAGLERLEDLSLDQPGEGLRLDAYGVGAQLGGQLGGLREQEVAGEDRDVVVPAGVGRHRSTAQLGLVHHVVVIERGEVGELDDARRGDHVVDVGMLAGLGRQQHEQRPEPLAAGLHQVAGGLGHEARPAADVSRQRLLDLGEPILQTRGQPLVENRESEARTVARHLRNCPASPARLSTGPGMTPRTRVAAAPTAMVAEVSTDGCTTYAAVSGSGSWKNITTMT